MIKLSQIWVICIEKVGHHNIGQFVLETSSVNKKNVNERPEIEVFLRSNLSFTIRVFTCDLAIVDNIDKKIYIFCPI